MTERIEEGTIVILSQSVETYSIQRLAQAVTNAGAAVEVINPTHCVCRLDDAPPSVYYFGYEMPRRVAVMPRVGYTLSQYGWMVLHNFERSGYPLLNSVDGIAKAQHKYLSLLELSLAGFPVPRTFCTRTALSIAEALEFCGGLPVIMKLLRGSQGLGVIYVESRHTMKSLLQAVVGLDQDIIIQQYIPEASKSDIRVLVLEDRVVASIKRTSPEDDFRSNVHRGGIPEVIDITTDERALCVRAAALFGLRLAGVDFVRTPGGPVIIEVNPNPGFEGMETATGVDVARIIVEAVMKLVPTHA